MAVIKRMGRLEDSFTMIPNDFIRDPTISTRAARIYIFVASHESGWNLNTRSVANVLDMSQSTVNRAMRELEEAGWVKRVQRVADDGTFGPVVYEVFTVSQNAGDGELTVSQNTVSGKTASGEMTHIKKTNSFKKTKEEKKTNNSCSNEHERDTHFDAFWHAYPRKVGKQKARTKFTTAVKRAGDPNLVIAGAQRLADDPNLPDKQYIPHPTTWLERDGWEDEPLPPRHTPATTSGGNTLEAWLGRPAVPDFIDAEVVEQRELGA